MDNSETGGIDSSGNIISGNNLWRSNVYIEVEPNTTYTLSRKIFNDNLSRVIRLYEYDNNKTFISPRKESSTESLTITTTANTKYLKWTIFELNATFTKSTVQAWLLQLELGTATTYTPHSEQVLPLTLGNIELCKIGDYQDYFYKESNKWYLHKEINKIVLDGSESGWSITTRSDGTTKFFARTYVNEILTNNTSASNELSNYFTVGNPYISIEDKIWLFKQGNNTTLRIGFKDQETITTVSEFKEWLSTHNTELYYPLATPTDTEITDTTLISQLEAINNAISYEEQTNISGSSNGNNPIFTVEGYQSTKLVLEERDAKYESLEARVALLE